MATKRRQRGTGGVHYSASRDRWIAEVLFEDVNGKQKKARRFLRTEAEADLVAASLAQEAERGLLPQQQQHKTITTFSELTEAWFRHEQLSESTERNYRTITNKWRPFLDDRRLDEIRHDDFTSIFAVIAASGVSQSTLNRVHNIWSRVCRRGMQLDLLVVNPVELATKPKVEDSRRMRGRALTREELDAFLDAAKSERLYAWYAVAGTLGMRPGEISGLRWQDVDFDAGTLSINQMVVEDTPKIAPPKTKKSRRTLAIPTEALEALHAHKERQHYERQYAAGLWPTDWQGELVFVSLAGTALRKGNMNRLTNEIKARAGIKGRLTPKDFRHTVGSLLVEGGASLTSVADLYGHADTRMLERTYRHQVTPVISLAKDMERN